MSAAFLFALLPILLGALVVIGLIVWAIARAVRSNQPEDRATFQTRAQSELEARRGELRALDGPEFITGRGRTTYTSFATTVVNGEVWDQGGQPVARYRLRWGAGALDAVIVTRAGTWTLASGEGGQVFTRDGQPFGRWVGSELQDASGRAIGSFEGSRWSARLGGNWNDPVIGRRGWQPVTLHGRVVGEVNDGGGGSSGLVQSMLPGLDDEARAWLTLLALRAAVERGKDQSVQSGGSPL